MDTNNTKARHSVALTKGECGRQMDSIIIKLNINLFNTDIEKLKQA